jgi:hypothetical protein
MSVTSPDRANVLIKLPRRTLQLMNDKLPAGITVLMVPPDALAPEFIRLPEGGEDERCPITGMSRTWVIERIRESQTSACPILSHHVRARGATRGVVLIDRSSYVSYIESFAPPEWAAKKTEEKGSAV